jgi:membrane protease YdiL (CAAX protease family)
MARVLEIGTALWCVALVVSLLVPALHQADRDWWPWACFAGMGGGGIALLYVRRRRGKHKRWPGAGPNPDTA